MKIMITFTNEELNKSMNLMRNISMTNTELPIKDEHIAGNFGEIKFDSSKNEITVDLKTAFMDAYSNLILAIINMVKSLAGTFEIFASSWFDNVRDLIAEKEEAEKSEKESDNIDRGYAEDKSESIEF